MLFKCTSQNCFICILLLFRIYKIYRLHDSLRFNNQIIEKYFINTQKLYNQVLNTLVCMYYFHQLHHQELKTSNMILSNNLNQYCRAIHLTKGLSTSEDMAISFLECMQNRYHIVHANCNQMLEVLNKNQFILDILQKYNMNHQNNLFHFKGRMFNLQHFHIILKYIDEKAMSQFFQGYLLSFDILLKPMKIIEILNYIALLLYMDMLKLCLLKYFHQF